MVLRNSGKLISELGVEPDHLQQLGHVNTLEEAVCRLDLTGLDNIDQLRSDLGNVKSNKIYSAQERDNHLILHDLHGTGGNVVDGGDHVAGEHQVLIWGAEGGLDGQGDELEAALRRRLE